MIVVLMCLINVWCGNWSENNIFSLIIKLDYFIFLQDKSDVSDPSQADWGGVNFTNNFKFLLGF